VVYDGVAREEGQRARKQPQGDAPLPADVLTASSTKS
jgi:hypothetical protein